MIILHNSPVLGDLAHQQGNNNINATASESGTKTWHIQIPSILCENDENPTRSHGQCLEQEAPFAPEFLAHPTNDDRTSYPAHTDRCSYPCDFRRSQWTSGQRRLFRFEHQKRWRCPTECRASAKRTQIGYNINAERKLLLNVYYIYNAISHIVTTNDDQILIDRTAS